MAYFQQDLTIELIQTSIILYDAAVSSYIQRIWCINNQKIKSKTHRYCKSTVSLVRLVSCYRILSDMSQFLFSVTSRFSFLQIYARLFPYFLEHTSFLSVILLLFMFCNLYYVVVGALMLLFFKYKCN